MQPVTPHPFVVFTKARWCPRVAHKQRHAKDTSRAKTAGCPAHDKQRAQQWAQDAVLALCAQCWAIARLRSYIRASPRYPPQPAPKQAPCTQCRRKRHPATVRRAAGPVAGCLFLLHRQHQNALFYESCRRADPGQFIKQPNLGFWSVSIHLHDGTK